MAFLKRLVDTVVNTVTGTSDPFAVFQVNIQDYAECRQLHTDEVFLLYGKGKHFDAVFYVPDLGKKAFCLFRLEDESEALAQFLNYCEKLKPLCISSRSLWTKEKLQSLCDNLRKNPSRSCAHLAADMGLKECLKHRAVFQYLNTPDPATQLYPIHLAVQSGQLDLVQEILILNVNLNVVDAEGNTVYHFAARTTPDIIRALVTRDRDRVINQCNNQGLSPLHIACLADNPRCLDELLIHNADVNASDCERYPIHFAVKVSSERCIECLLKRFPISLKNVQDKKYGGTPVHWAKTKKVVKLLAESGCDINIRSHDGSTPLHVMIKRNRLECLVALMTYQADTNATDNEGNTPFHLAILTGDVDLVRALLVFDANVNIPNAHSVTPRHLAAMSSHKSRDAMLFTLHMVGAARCSQTMNGCSDGCRHNGNEDGKLDDKKPSPTNALEKQLFDDIIVSAAVQSVASGNGTDKKGVKVLSLDGGGIRGLILIQSLLAIEKACGRPITDCFDWIAGTSTGGVLALALLHGKSARYTQGLYFRLKDEVFCGNRPYEAERFETFLKKEFGENTRMMDVTEPKVMVTSVLGDRHPAALHLFTNYEKPAPETPLHRKASVAALAAPNSEPVFDPLPRQHEQTMWHAARSSGAAPTFFRSMGRFIDGGLIANNPTLDVMTEISEYNIGLKATNQDHLVKPIELVVSLGCGRIPTTPVTTNCDVYRPGGIFDVVKVGQGGKALFELLLDQATISEGRPVDRARAWCGMINVPFFRFSPKLSEKISLDCKDDFTLCKMLWETQVYLYNHRDQLKQLAVLLNPSGQRHEEMDVVDLAATSAGVN